MVSVMSGIFDHNFVTRSIKHYKIATNCFDSHVVQVASSKQFLALSKT